MGLPWVPDGLHNVFSGGWRSRHGNGAWCESLEVLISSEALKAVPR